MSSKKEKYFVFQVMRDGIQVEVGRQVKGPGRPPVGPNIMKADDGNVYIASCLESKPADVSGYVEVELEDGKTIWYEKNKSSSKSVVRKYKLVNDSLIDEGPAGRGRPAKGYVKIEDDLVVDGVNLKGHFYNNNEVEDVVESNQEPVESQDEFEEVEDIEDDNVVDEDDVDLEAQAMADAAADFAADGGEFQEVDLEEEEPV